MTADIKIFTADSKLRFPFPREVRFLAPFMFFSFLFFCIFFGSSKNFFFLHFFDFQVFQRRFFSIFSYSGDSLVVIFGIFSVLHFLIVFFYIFWQKKNKSEKSENCLKPCKIRTIVKVATFKKKGEERRQHVEKHIDFWWKIGLKSKQKSGKTALTIKCTKRACFEGALFVKRRFFNDFWPPARSQNELQNGPLDSELGLAWPRGAPGSPQGQF